MKLSFGEEWLRNSGILKPGFTIPPPREANTSSFINLSLAPYESQITKVVDVTLTNGTSVTTFNPTLRSEGTVMSLGDIIIPERLTASSRTSEKLQSSETKP